MAPRNQVTQEPTVDDTAAEQQVNAVVEAASTVAANWIHSPKAVGALATATGLTPAAIHLGFMLAHMFHHHYEKYGITPPDAPTSPSAK